MAAGVTKTIKKLVEGDSGYVAGSDTYEVTITTVMEQKFLTTLAAADAAIANCTARKVDELVLLDSAITQANAQKSELLAAS